MALGGEGKGCLRGAFCFFCPVDANVEHFFPVNFRSVGQLFQSGFGEGGVGGGASPVCHNMAY